MSQDEQITLRIRGATKQRLHKEAARRGMRLSEYLGEKE